MAQTYQTQRLGWLPDYPDYRDYTVGTTEVNARRRRLNEKPVQELLAQVGVTTATASVPGSVDLRHWFSAVEDQGDLGSCTAHAGVGLVEYFERRAFGKHIDASRLFLYKVTRNLLHWQGDTGAFLRTAMGALVLLGSRPRITSLTSRPTSTLSRQRFATPSRRTIRRSSITVSIPPTVRRTNFCAGSRRTYLQISRPCSGSRSTVRSSRLREVERSLCLGERKRSSEATRSWPPVTMIL